MNLKLTINKLLTLARDLVIGLEYGQSCGKVRDLTTVLVKDAFTLGGMPTPRTIQ